MAAMFDRTPVSADSLTEVQVLGPCLWASAEFADGVFPLDDYEPEYGTIDDTFRAYGVRWSMPGYLDCGEWETFPVKREAERHARELRRDLRGDD